MLNGTAASRACTDRRMRGILLAVAAVLCALALWVPTARGGTAEGGAVASNRSSDPGRAKGSFPRLANIYFPQLGTTDLKNLARWDLLVLAKRAEDQDREALMELRVLNPDIMLLAHMAVSYHGDYLNPPINGDMREELYANDWWLEDTRGAAVEWGTYNRLLNVTPSCPRNAEGERLCDWLPEYIAERLGPGGLWDGVYLDGCWDRVAWMNDWISVPVDADGDGVADDRAELDAAWREGMEIIVNRLRELVGEDYIIATNGNNTHYETCNGSTRENFPYMHGGWYENIADEEHGYVAIDAHYRDPSINVINTIWSGPVALGGPVASFEYEREFLFTFSSTLVYGDGYFSLDGGAGLPNHAQTWWHRLYDVDLGEPLGRAEPVDALPGAGLGIEHADMIKRRRFTRGVAVVNPTGRVQTIALGGVYYRSDSWNGSFYPHAESISSVEISSRSGSVLVGSGRTCTGIPEVACWQGKHGGIHVAWESVPGASAYSVYRTVGKTGQDEDELLAVVDDTEYAVLSVEDAGACAYRVAAIDEIGCEGQPSCPAAVVTQLGSDPSMPSLAQVWDGTVTLDEDGSEVPGGGFWGRSEIDAAAGPTLTTLRPCYPNPAGERTTISFEVGSGGRGGGAEPVYLAVYDVAGRRVQTLVDDSLPAGGHSIDWDVRGSRGARVASGCYFAVLRVGNETRTGKILVTD